MNPSSSQPLLSTPLHQPPTAPVNATDRNVTTSAGMFSGHITLPSSFLSFLLILVFGSFLVVIHWCFDEVTTIRQRLIAREQVIDRYVERAASMATPPAITPTPK